MILIIKAFTEEGRERLSWILHDTIVHPICGVLWSVGMVRVADKLHDRSIPKGSENEH